jgi:hypothetical protein
VEKKMKMKVNGLVGARKFGEIGLQPNGYMGKQLSKQ